MTFHRIHSRAPLKKPTLGITASFSPDVPGAEGPNLSAGFIETWTMPTRSRLRAEKEARRLRKLNRFATITIQTIDVDAGFVVQTDRGPVLTKPQKHKPEISIITPLLLPFQKPQE